MIWYGRVLPLSKKRRVEHMQLSGASHWFCGAFQEPGDKFIRADTEDELLRAAAEVECDACVLAYSRSRSSAG